MSAIAAWIMSILAIAITGTLIDLVMPSGRMNKYLKSVFASLTVLVIILPLPTLFKNGFDFEQNSIFTPEFTLDENYLSYANEIKMDYLAKGLAQQLKSEGLNGVEVKIEGSFTGGDIRIKSIKINLDKLVIDEKLEHINKYELVRELAAKYLNVDKGVVVIT